MSKRRELLPIDVLIDLLGEEPFDLADMGPGCLGAEGGARIILQRLEDAGFEIVPLGKAVLS